MILASIDCLDESGSEDGFQFEGWMIRHSHGRPCSAQHAYAY